MRGVSNIGIRSRLRVEDGEARDICREAIVIQEQLVSKFPQQAEHRFDLAQSLNKLGYLCWDIGEYPESECDHRVAGALKCGVPKQAEVDFRTSCAIAVTSFRAYY